MTFSLAYTEREPYSLQQSFGEGAAAIPVSIDLPRGQEWRGKFEWHRNATWHELTVGGENVHPRFHVSLEYIDISDDPERQNRTVGVVTYEIPLPSGSSLPLSLTYANHSEFLGDPDKQFSAHLGFSYKLPMIGGK